MLRLPDFLIIGGMRCGTTSLHELLRMQPALYFPENKESHFFDRRNPDLGVSIERYMDLFSDCPAESFCGEATPDYLTTEGCDELIHSVLPEAKLIVILRDPVERTWSHYLFSVLNKVETMGFQSALDAEAERLTVKSDHTDIFFSYLQRSRYIEHLERFESLFGNDRLKIVFFEDLVKKPQQVLMQLLDFLDVSFIDEFVELPHLNEMSKLYEESIPKEPVQTSRLSRLMVRLSGKTDQEPKYKKVECKKEELADSDREYLQSYFSEYNAKLEKYVDRPLPWPY